MKKSLWVLYGFLNFIFNFIVTIIFHDLYFFCICCFRYGWCRGIGQRLFSRRIHAGLELIFFFSIYILINMKIYKFVTRKHKICKVYLRIPLCTMALGMITGASLFILRSYELSMH